MDGAPVEKEEVEEKAATNLIDVDNLIEISLKWNVHMKLSYDAGFHKCTYVVFVQDHTDITFLKYNHSAELVNTQFFPLPNTSELWGGTKIGIVNVQKRDALSLAS